MPPRTEAELEAELDKAKAELSRLQEEAKAGGASPAVVAQLRGATRELDGTAKEIRGMSESTAHALLEQMKRLNANLEKYDADDLEEPAPAPPSAAGAPKERGFLDFIFGD